MAASIGRGFSLAGYLCRRHVLGDFRAGVSLRKANYSSTTVESDNKDDVTDTELYGEAEEEIRRQEEALRDISGLTAAQKRRIHGQVPEIRNEYQQTARYQARLYGKFGKESGIDPRLMWPTKAKAVELTELLNEWEPSLEERMATLTTQKEEKNRKLREREEKVERNMAKMNQWIAEYRQKLAKKDEEALAREEKKRKILEEAREYFGYYVDPRDAKFQEMLEEKERKEKELAKKKKKEKRLERLAAKLQHMAQEAEEKS